MRTGGDVYHFEGSIRLDIIQDADGAIVVGNVESAPLAGGNKCTYVLVEGDLIIRLSDRGGATGAITVKDWTSEQSGITLGETWATSVIPAAPFNGDFTKLKNEAQTQYVLFGDDYDDARTLLAIHASDHLEGGEGDDAGPDSFPGEWAARPLHSRGQQQIGSLALQRLGHPDRVAQGQVLLASLDGADVRAMQAAFESQSLLRIPQVLPSCANRKAEAYFRRSALVHARIATSCTPKIDSLLIAIQRKVNRKVDRSSSNLRIRI